MSLLNQPSRLVISGDDAEWSNNASTGGQLINMTLPEPIVGAEGVDCARAVIPNTQYPIPNYQNTFYYTYNGVVSSVVLTNNRNFTSINDLITQLNLDAVAQSKPVVFSYDTNTTRISATIGSSTPTATITVGFNNTIQVTKDNGNGTYTTRRANIAPGTYTITQFEPLINFAFNDVMVAIDNTVTGSASINPTTKIITFTLTAARPSIYIDFGTNYTIPQETALQNLYGLTTGLIYNFTATTVVGNQAMGFNPPTVAITPKASWPSQFSLNTRLGFPNNGLSGTGGTAIVGTFMPNLIRSRVLYLLCNISLNDSISTDGLRTVLAKMPVNSTYGGLTIYEQKDYNFCRIVQSSYQNVELSLLDDNYQPYQLTIEEPMEIELVFTYEPVRNG